MPFRFNLPGEQDPDTRQSNTGSVGALDLAKSAASGAATAVAAIPSAIEYATEKSAPNLSRAAGAVSGALHDVADSAQSSMSDAAKEANQNPLSHPVGWAGMRIAEFVPQLAAIMAVPESALAQATLGGAMQAGSVLDQAMTRTRDLRDQDLQTQSPVYAQLRRQMDEASARAQLHQLQVNGGDMLLSALTGAVGSVGVGRLVSGGAEAAGRGLARGAGIGALEAAPAMSAQNAQADYTGQEGNVRAGFQPSIDYGQVARAGVEGLATGAIIGGAAGGVHGVMNRPAKGGVEQVPDIGPARDELDALVPEQTSQSANAPRPPETPAPPPPGEAAAASVAGTPPKVGPKGKKAIAKGKKQVEAVGEVKPTAEQAAALAPAESATGKPTVDQMVDEAVASTHGMNATTEQAQIPPEVTAPIPEPARQGTPLDTPATAPQPRQGAQQPLPMATDATTGVKPVPVAPEGPGPLAEPPVPTAKSEPTGKVLIAGEPGKELKIQTASEVAPEVIDKSVAALQTKELASLQEELKKRGVTEVPASVEEARSLLADNPAKGPGRKDLTKAEQAKHQTDAESAKQVFEQFAPSEPEKKLFGTPHGRKLTADRLESMLAAAKERGIETPKYVTKQTPDHVAWLVNAREALAELRAGKFDKQRYQDFLTENILGQAGDFKSFRARRKAEGEQNVKKSQPDKEVVDAPVDPRTLEKEVVGREEPTQTHEVVDDNLLDREELSDDTPPPVEREKVQLKEGEGYTVAKAPTKEVVEKPGERFGRFKPKVEGKIKLTPKVREVKEKIEAASKEAKDTHEVTPAFISEKLGDQGQAQQRRAVRALHTQPLGDSLGAIKFEGLNKLIADRIKPLVGDLKIHVLSEEDMGTYEGVSANESSRGQWTAKDFNDRGRVLIRADQLKDPAQTAHSVLHESIHAAFQQVLYRRADIRDHVQRIMNDVLAHDPVTKLHYGMDSTSEFVAEALSNPEFQRVLMNTPVSSHTAAALGMDRSVVKTAWDFMVSLVRRVLKLPEGTHTAMEAALRVAQQIEPEAKRFHRGELEKITHDPRGVSERLIEKPVERVTEYAKEKLQDASLGSKGRQALYKLVTNHQLAAIREKLFPEGVAQRFVDAIEKMGTAMNHFKGPGNDLISRAAQLERKYEGDKGWNRYLDVVYGSTEHQIHPDRPLSDKSHEHLGKNAMHGQAGKAAHVKISALYRSLPSELKDLFNRNRAYYEATHAEEAKAYLKNILDVVTLPGTDKTALAERIFNHGLTQPELDGKGAFSKEVANALANARELKKIPGAYTHLQRRGDFVVTAKSRVETPSNAMRHDADTLVFGDKKAADAWVAQNPEYVRSFKKRWYDDKGNLLARKDDGVTASGNGPFAKYHVRLKRDHVTFHETEKAARVHRDELAKAGYEDISDVGLRHQNPDLDYRLMSPQLASIMKSIEQTSANTAHVAELKRMAAEMSLRFMPGTRVEHHRIKRRTVAGYSRDYVRNLTDFNTSSSSLRAKLAHQKEADAALDAMRAHADKYKYEGEDKTILRDETVREFENRLYGKYAPENAGKQSQFVRAAMTISFLRYMASPAHLILHMTHPTMISAPVIGARHGIPRAYGALVTAYRDMGGLWQPLKQGFKDAARFAKDAHAKQTNWVDYFKGNLAGVKDHADLARMLETLTETGHIHPDAGMEVHANDPSQSRFMTGLNRVDQTFRQITQATESINRVAEAISAYRLEMLKTGDHDAAVQYAKKTLANSQGLYSRTNAAPLFRNPYLKPFLQFKQFPQMMYHLLARNLYLSFKGDTPEVRREALRQFAGVVSTHAIMAGALGLPLEILKIPVMLANSFGVTATSWQDLENKLQEKASEELGSKPSEILFHGILRALGPAAPDVRHRLGLGSLLLYGEPRAARDGVPTAQSVNDYLLNFMAGSPGSLLSDTVRGTQALAKGDFGGAVENIIPAKALKDVAKAARLAYEGKPTKRGQPGMEPLGVTESIVQGLGFTPARVANYGAARNMAYTETARTSDAKTKAIQSWVDAKPEDKTKRLLEARAQGIKMSELTAAYDRQKRGKQQHYELGFSVTDRNKDILDRASKTFNAR